jgi:uncharacterized DUF497 family protein
VEISGLVWLPDVVEKIQARHQVTVQEVEELFRGSPRVFFVEEGNYLGEDLYLALGRSAAGRYLMAVFICKKTGEALVISARDMTAKERRRYGQK